MALGWLGLSWSEYMDATLRSLHNRIRGRAESVQRTEQGHWERVRWQSALIVGMFAKKGKKIKPKDLIVFPWEEEHRPPPPPPRQLTPEEIKEKFAEADRKMRERWQVKKT